MTNFAIQAYLSYKALFRWLNWWAYISSVFLVPVFWLLMFALAGRFAGRPEAAEAYAINMAAYSISRILLGGIIQSYFWEGISGTVPVLFVSRGSRLVTYWSRGALHFPNGILTVTSSLVFARLLLNLDFSRVNWLTLSCVVILIAASTTAFALCVGNFSMVSRDLLFWTNGTYGVFWALTGVIVPRTSLPGFLGEVGQFLPLTNGLNAFRGAFTGAGFGSVGGDLVGELAVGLGYAIMGSIVSGLLEKEAKRRGTYEFAA